MTGLPIMKCPVCGNGLAIKEKTMQCRSCHSFDLAREGYVNLLTVREKSSRNPGDSKEMLDARRRFLNGGHYDKIAGALVQAVSATRNQGAQQTKTPFTIADIGCGEGHYLCALYDGLADAECEYVGIDIARDGIRLASKKQKSATWIVANVFKLPLMDRSIDCCLSMFTVECMDEMERILKKNGAYIRVYPGKNHLIELKQTVYDEMIQRERIEIKRDAFRLQDSVNITYSFTLDAQQDILDLLVMTPHYWNVKPEKIEYLKTISHMTLTVDVIMETHRKK